MKSLNEALHIIHASKRYEFVDGENGATVLVITDYNTGEELRLDLSRMDEETLDTLQVDEEPEEYEYDDRAYHEFTASGGCRD